MGMIDKIKNYIGVGDDYDYDEPEEAEALPQQRETPSKKSANVVNIHTTAQLQVVLAKPERYDDAAAIADHLKEKHTVVLNLEDTDKVVARRAVDFLSGVAYAGGGQIKKVAVNTFIITPYNVNIMGDLLGELENSGVFF